MPLAHTVTLRIDTGNDDSSPGIRLIGRIRSGHLNALQAELKNCPKGASIDLAEVTNLDVDAVRFLGARESEGFELRNCSPFIREWIQREQEAEGRQ
jgi:hypothetical protein